MKRWFLLLTITLLLAPSAFSQQGEGQQTAESEPQETSAALLPAPVDRLSPSELKTRLELTEEQEARISKLWEEYQHRNTEIRQDTSITQDQRIQRLRQSRQEYLNTVRSVLTPQQLKQFEELIKTAEKEQKEGGVSPGFQLTAQQRQQILQISERYRQLRENVMQDPTLDANTKQRRLKELEGQMMEEIKEVSPALKALIEKNQPSQKKQTSSDKTKEENVDKEKPKDESQGESKPEEEKKEKKEDKPKGEDK